MCNINNRVLAMAIGLLLLGLTRQCYGALQPRYYNKKCKTTIIDSVSVPPKLTTTEVDVERTVTEAMRKIFDHDPRIVASLLRMQFHDCFVKVGFSFTLQF